MHCSANIGPAGDVALFFGLSGTGKTTLSSDPDRRLIGDDEHGWSDRGVFNFEGGCYAKTIRLSAEAEPQIYATTRRFGTVLENVAIDRGHPRASISTTIASPRTPAPRIRFLHRQRRTLRVRAGIRRNIVMLTADAFGVLPPIARPHAERAMYHFLSGYTAKVAGTEKGVTEPKATFSTCFGAPFLPLPPGRYAAMLGERIARHQVARVAGQYRLDRRAVRHRHAHEDRLHPRDDSCGALRRAGRGRATSAIPSSISTCRRRARTFRPDVLNPRNTWPTSRPTTRRPRRLAAMFARELQDLRTGDEVRPARIRSRGRASESEFDVIGTDLELVTFF